MQEFLKYFISGESPLWYFVSIPAGVLLSLAGFSGLIWRLVSELQENSTRVLCSEDDYEFDLR